MLTPIKISTGSFRILSLVHVFLFAGAIVGETVALSMVVSVAGPQIIGRLYLVNGALLFLLPPFFFRNIDRVNRGKLFSSILLFTSCLLFAVFVALKICILLVNENAYIAVMRVIYPLSYLSKTVLFLTFWTMANDICRRGEAKKTFPRIAAWGFAGGMGGACVARLMLEFFDSEIIMLIWSAAYFTAFVFSLRITKTYQYRLLKKEQAAHKQTRLNRIDTLIHEIREVMSIDLVRLIGVLYFLVFVAIFSLDYLFWHTCHIWFSTSKTIASFQFTFYLIHGIATTAGLLFVVPSCISKWGFPRIFAFMPYVLLSGSALLFLIGVLPGTGALFVFSILILFQFLRYVAFENTFAPIYQMFFASISKDKRGRAKTVLEGIIKPSAIILAGLLLIMLEKKPPLILIAIAIMSVLMVWAAQKVRKIYLKGLIPAASGKIQSADVISEIGGLYDIKIVSIINEYGRAEDPDLRSVAIKILAHSGTRQALAAVMDIYGRETGENVKEMIARSLGNFYWNETSAFIGPMLKDLNPRIRANAIVSLNTMNCNWKWRLKEQLKSLLFDPDIRVRIEAAQFLWKSGDRSERETVQAYMSSLTCSENVNKRSAGLFLAGILRPDGWEKILIDNLGSSSFQVFEKCVDVIFTQASESSKTSALRIVGQLSREHIAALGKVIIRRGATARHSVAAFLPESADRRMIYEMVHSLRRVFDVSGSREKAGFLSSSTESFLLKWALNELKNAYFDGFIWDKCLALHGGAVIESHVKALDDALHMRMLRVCEWALDVLALLERNRGISWNRMELDINEFTERMDMVEVLENYGNEQLPALVCNILRGDAWGEIARHGKHYFGFETAGVEANPARFVHSDNKWVCFCALYYISRTDSNGVVRRSIRDTLEFIIHEKQRYLSRAAQQILDETITTGDDMRNSFDLLEIALFLKKTLLFRNVPAEKLMALSEISNRETYRRDTLISREGDIADHLYIVNSGSLKVIKEKNGVRTILSIVKPGESYGEIGLLNQAPRSASAVANEDCVLCVIKRSALKKLLLEMPEIAYNFLEIFSDKLRKSGEELALLQSTLSGRILEEAKDIKD